MSRYIDADWLCNELGDINMDIYTDEVKEYIDSAPSIDIVRCRECQHWRNGDGACGVCRKTSLHQITKADDFCSYGSRSEIPNNSKERKE